MNSELRIEVRVQPRARRTLVVREAPGRLKVWVTPPPADGRANDAVRNAVADWLGVKRRQVHLLVGETNRQKIFAVSDPSDAVRQRLQG